MKIVRDITNVRELPLEYYEWIINKAQIFFEALKDGDSRIYENYLKGWNVVPIFTQKSTRTHDSFLEALNTMGAKHSIGISDPERTSLMKGESLADTIDTYVGYGAHFIVMRDGREGAVKWAKTCALKSFAKRIRSFAQKNKKVPRNLVLPLIFNGGDGSHNHPSQLLLDCASMFYHFKRFTNLNIGIINDLKASRVFASQADACSLLNWNLRLLPIKGSEPSERSLQRLKDTSAKFKIYDNFEDYKKQISTLDILYVHRFQKNLRNDTAGLEECYCMDKQVLEQNNFNQNSILMHARPIDKTVKEISNDLRYHPWNYSGIESDFGLPTRMAMAAYVIEHNLFSLKGIISSINSEDFTYVKEKISSIIPSKIKSEQKYTTAYIEKGFVIDHIPAGCGSVMNELVCQLLPGTEVILSSNVKGSENNSIVKDVIKIFGDIEWTLELDNLVALFSDTSIKKSCRVSRFESGKRQEKWTFREYNVDDVDKCKNEKCITNDKLYNESIDFKFTKRVDGKLECPFCHCIQ